MTSKQLIKNWRNLSIRFKSNNEIRDMTDMFLICWGETNMDFNGKNEKLVVFDQGGEQGSSGLFCQSDKEDICWAFGWDEKNKTSVKSNIGTFIKKAANN